MKLPTFRLTKNSQLIEILAGIQIIGLAIALVCGAAWAKSKIGTVVRQQIIKDNQLIAAQLGRVIRLSHDQKIEFGSESWERLQQLVEKIELPNQGFVCVADRGSGQLLCHPQLRSRPGLRNSIVGDLPLQVGEEKATVMTALETRKTRLQIDENFVVTGIAGSNRQSEIVSVADLGSLEAILMVHQSEVASRKAITRILTPLSAVGLVIGLALVVVTTKSSVSVLKRYEHELATINKELERIVHSRTQSLMKTRDAVIFGLAKLSESRDADTGEHLDRIRYYSTRLANAMAECRGRDDRSVDDKLIDQIGLASSLHDIGKVGIPDRVLLKPGKLDVEERHVMETHTLIGEQCLEAIESHLGQDGFLSLAKEVCAYHHEKWDGTGYPYGLVGEQIPIAARIVAVADVYDALRSKRPYKEPLSHDAACELIREGSGKHFDPTVVDAFQQCNKDFSDWLRVPTESSNTAVACID